ncbi:hypothetical protein ACRRTK_017105 [Alexandromys fortis]
MEEFTSPHSTNTETIKVNYSLETKFRWIEYGLTLTGKGNKDNIPCTEITKGDRVPGTLSQPQDSIAGKQKYNPH